MDRTTPQKSGQTLIDRIQRLSAEAEWSVDELREVLKDEGVNPDQFVKDVKTRIEELLTVSAEDMKAKSEFESLPLLAKLRRITGMKATLIAEKTGVTAPFLSDLSGHPKAIPLKVQKEIARRAESLLPGVSELDVLESFTKGLSQQTAAFRDDPFPEEEIDFEKIVQRSDMSDEQKRYWLSLL